MTRHYPDLSCAFDWLKQISLAARLIRSASQIWVVTRHQYGIFVLISQTSFRGETSRDVAKCRLFSQASSVLLFKAFNGANKSCFPAPLKLNLVFTVAFVIAAVIFSEAYHLALRASEKLLYHEILIGFETITPFTSHTKSLQQTQA